MASLTRRRHEILVGLSSEHRQKVKHVQKQILIATRHRTYQSLVGRNDLILIVWLLGWMRHVKNASKRDYMLQSPKASLNYTIVSAAKADS